MVCSVDAQPLQRLDIPFIQGGKTLLFPLAGGLNSPQFSEVDLNNDGLSDLHVFDRVGNKQLTFLNTGQPGAYPYRFAPEYIDAFPEITHWMLLRDYNGDNIMDIFSYADLNFDAVMVFTGYYEDGHIGFERFTFNAPKNVIFVPRAIGGSNQLMVTTIDYPAVDDVDCDGDLDILTFNIVGGYVEFYANQSVEQGFGRDSLIYKLADNCWGGFFESGAGNEVDLAASSEVCVNKLLSGELELRHIGSTLMTFDADGDLDKELVLGDISFNNINFLTNGGDCNSPWMNAQDPDFPSYDVSAAVPVFPAAFFLDVNNDRLGDLLVAPNAAAGGADHEIWFYKNTGTASQASFQLQKKDFLVDEMIDLGSGSRPVFVDYNADGLTDLVVSNSSFYEPFGEKNARLYLYKNIGTAAEPAFQLVDDDYLNMNQFSQNTYAFTPSFGDVDNDGDADVVIGELRGQLFYAENTAGAGKPFQFQTPTFGYMGINVGQASVPQFVDLDRDSLPDLIVGERNGNINFFKNQGTREVPFFSSDPDQMVLGGVDTRIPGYTTGYSAPLFFEEEGRFLLLTGTETGRLELYDDIDNNIAGTFSTVTETYGTVKEGERTHLDLADINNDGLLELAVGNFSGGIAIYQTGFKSNTSTAVREGQVFLKDLQLRPNPTAEQVRISLDDPVKNGILTVFNASGQVVTRQNWQGAELRLALSSWPPGVYWVQLKTPEGIRIKKLLITR